MRKQRLRSMRLAGVLLTSVLLAACASSGSTDEDAGTGGASASGGTYGTGAGGASAKGGTTGTGGATGTGGTHGTGGTVGTGGNGTGGAGGKAGNSGGGGTPGTGGVVGVGGKGGQGTGGAGGVGTGGTGATGGSGGGTAAYNPCPTNGDPCKVLPLGDSITYGLITVMADQASSDPSINGKDSHGGYRVELFTKAVNAQQNMTFVGSQTNGPTMAAGTTFPKSHEGWSGYTISMIVAKAMANDASYKPNIVLLHAGTNDTYMSDPSGAPSRLSSAVDALTTELPDALIVVAKIIPYPSQVSNVNLINNSIPAMVQSKVAAGKHVVMADLNSGFQTSTMLSADGIHPNQTGYNWMGDTWYAAISSLLPGS